MVRQCLDYIRWLCRTELQRGTFLLDQSIFFVTALFILGTLQIVRYVLIR